MCRVWLTCKNMFAATSRSPNRTVWHQSQLGCEICDAEAATVSSVVWIVVMPTHDLLPVHDSKQRSQVHVTNSLHISSLSIS
jgi:hypothetical protein